MYSILTFVPNAARGEPPTQADPATADHRPAEAETDAIGLRHSYGVCLDASGGADAAMQDCISTKYVYQDARLNTIYGTLMRKLPKGERTRLRVEEREWMTYRDATCKLTPDGGQGQRLESNDCSVEQTAKRATALEARQH
ncbi:MAG: lysozyme inhibitor LprI family protein [Burkholderiales bacterium]